jgi:hypothetical protein
VSERKESSYKRKKPFVYSETYRHWKDEVRKNGACGDKARALSCSHAKTFRYTLEGC